MSRAPDWTEEEFRLLLSEPQTPAADLQERLPQRSVEAINLVRQGVEQYRTKGSSPLLSQMMVRVLEENGA